MTPASLICVDCHAAAQPLQWRCAICGGALDFAHYPSFDPATIKHNDFSLWRYESWLPVPKRVSLGEGLTPLTKLRVNGYHILAKLEYLNPTGSYKDRGTVTMMNHIVAHDVNEVVEDSSGNAGAAVAAYSSALGIKARIYVPASASPAKKALIQTFGGELVEIPGPQHAKTDACQQAAKTMTYASHAWSPYFVLGQMTVAFEVWEQLGHTAPDAVVTPIGHGGLFLGFARGFKLLQHAGLIEQLPQLYAVQSEHCDPIVRAWEQEDTAPARVEASQTVADGIIVNEPVRGKEVLQQLRDSQGAALRVADEAVIAAQQMLAKCGLIAEPTSAVTVAALPQIMQHLGEHKTLLCALTGNGLKNI